MTSPTATTIEIPERLRSAFAEERGSECFERWALETMVLTAVGQGFVSTGCAAELLGLGYFDTLRLLKERNVPNSTTAEDLEQDYQDLQRSSAESPKR